MMKRLAYIAVVLRPTEKSLVWINSLPNSEVELSLEDVRADCTTVLLPSFETFHEAEDFLQENYLDLFVQELNSWDQDRTTWPTDMTFDNFLEMFDLKFHTMVFEHLKD